MLFEDIFCQDRAIDILKRAFRSGRVSHTYIFAGPDGVGKNKTAQGWAKLLLCKRAVVKKDLIDCCNECDSCRLFNKDSHPDFVHIYKELNEFTKEGKGKTPPLDLPIGVIREFLIEHISVKPSISQKKVYVISEAEKLNHHSQNSLLKCLEEPPAYCCIIMLCTRLDKLLPTIKSRSQIVRFGPVSEAILIEKIRESGIDNIQTKYFSRLSQGSLGMACRLAELELAGAQLYIIKMQLLNSLVDCELATALNLADDLIDKRKQISTVWIEIEKDVSKTDITRKAAKILIQMFISIFSDIMKVDIQKAGNEVNSDQVEQLKRLARRFSPEEAAEQISVCYKMGHWLESNVNERLIFEHLLLNLFDSDKIPAY